MLDILFIAHRAASCQGTGTAFSVADNTHLRSDYGQLSVVRRIGGVRAALNGSMVLSRTWLGASVDTQGSGEMGNGPLLLGWCIWRTGCFA